MLILNHLEPSQSFFVLKHYVYTFILILLCTCADSQFYLKTIAGTGTSSDTGDNGPATLATTNLPSGIWGDSIGNIYFGEDTGNRVRKISLSGIISTFIGTGGSYDAGGLGGPALTVNLDAVSGVYGDDKNKSLYFSGIYFIWRYDFSTGNVTRIGGDITFRSGRGTQGFRGDGGPATEAFLYSPLEIYLSSVGILYIADSFNNRVRLINSTTGTIDTFAGSGACCRSGGSFGGDYGQATNALLNFPSGVWGNSLGVVYIADTRNNRIRVVNATGFITTFTGTGDASYNGDDISATLANVHSPSVVKGDTLGNIFISTGDCRIRVVSAIGIIDTIIGTGTCGPASTSEQLAVDSTIDNVYGLWIDSKGNIYFTEYFSGFVRMIFDGTPTTLPTALPSIVPSDSPSQFPTVSPSTSPTELPTENPTTTPSEIPTELPSEAPSEIPTANPSELPSVTPSEIPSAVPSEYPSEVPSVIPTGVPSETPTQLPSTVPSLIPTAPPTVIPSLMPSEIPSATPSVLPTEAPSLNPTEALTMHPSSEPSIDPSATLTAIPTDASSLSPSISASCLPSEVPSYHPTVSPSLIPTKFPSLFPSHFPTIFPSKAPTTIPSAIPTTVPSFVSTPKPTVQPSLSSPSVVPSIAIPSVSPPPTTMLYFSLTSNVSTWKEVISLFGVYSSNIAALSLLDVSFPSEGSSMIIFGSRDLSSRVINASMPATRSHYPITQVSPSYKRDKASRCAIIPGDLNKDGQNDVVVCYPLTSSCSVFFGHADSGLVKVKVGTTIYGPTSPTVSPSSSPAATFFGFAVDNAEDLNKDGYVDIIISALRGKICYVIYGRPSWVKELKMSAMKSGGRISDGADGYKIIADSTTTLTGLSVAGVGDMNGDAQHDLAISVQRGSAFVVYVVWGEGINAKDVSLSEVGNGIKGFRVFGEQGYYSGLSISRGGDLNDDGFTDLVIGAIPSSGKILKPKGYLLFGMSKGSSFADVTLGESSNHIVEIIGAGGFIVSGPGDVNNDGFDDVMLTHVKTYIDKGNTYIVSYPGSISSPPSLLPSSSPSSPPSNPPSSQPSSSYPTQSPSLSLPLSSSLSPSVFSTTNESLTPSLKPTVRPTRSPSLRPSAKPKSVAPSVILSANPTRAPSHHPTLLQTKATIRPSQVRTRSNPPSRMPIVTRNPSPSLVTASSSEFQSRAVNSSRASNQQSIIYGKDGENEIFEISSLSSDGKRRSGWSGTIIGGRGRKIYRLYPKDPSQPMNRIVLKDFDRSKDQLDVSHILQIRGKENLAFLTNPLAIILPDNQKILFSRYKKLQDLSGSNFVFQSASTSSSSSSSGLILVSVDSSLLAAIIVVVIFVLAVVELMARVVKVEIHKNKTK